MEDNWIALFVSIVTEKTVNKALSSVGLIEDRKPIKPYKRGKYTESQIKEMLKFKAGRTWREVAEKYNITINMVYSAIKQYERKV